MALITPAIAGRTARDVVAARLTRRDRDVPGIVMLLLLLLAAGVTMLVLFVLLATLVTDSWPVITNQGFDFVTNTIGSNPSTIGVWQATWKMMQESIDGALFQLFTSLKTRHCCRSHFG